jgi:hypothetical protein
MLIVRTGLVVVACALAGAGCKGRGGPATPPVTVTSPDGSGSSGTAMTAKPTVAAKVTGEKPGRPPLLYLTTEVVLDNPTDAPRWFIVAKHIPPDDGAGGGVDRLEVRGSGAAVIGTLFGTGGFHATRLAPKSKVTITNLPVDWWRSDPPGPMPGLDVTIADDLTLDGKPAADWFGVLPLVPDGTTIDAGGEATHEHRTDGPEAAVVLAGATPSTVTLAK